MLFVGYVIYLGCVTWGVGKLSVTLVDELNKMSCRAECDISKIKGRPLRTVCEQYCKR